MNAWLYDWLAHPTRDVLYRSTDSIKANVYGGVDEAIVAIRKYGRIPILSGRTLLALKSDQITLL